MNISNRLLTIANFVPKNSIAIDIGTDHGYIPAYLIMNNISKKVIATDISEESLNKGKNYIKGLKLENEIETRIGDGFEVLKSFEADTAIIAGMGGLLIADILESRKNISRTITHFILQPMVASNKLREYLYNNNFEILDERLVKEGEKFYEVIYTKHGKGYIEKDIYFDIGKKLVENKDPLLEEFINYKIKLAENILDKIEDKTTLKSKERMKALTEEIEKYKEVLMCVKG
ncbi:MAG TPA: class I SAM-dependent methyltransferase [Tissierellales bacterium]|nr:class I SAM-dependent methyltransferase [Tissierellales bacterium]